MIRRLQDWLLWSEGSTRPVGLLRMALVALLWNRFADDFVLYRMQDAVEIAVALSFFASTALLFVGLWTRVAAGWTAATLLTVFVFLGHLRDVEPYRHHHVFLLVASAVLLALTPCGRSLSVDRWLALRRADATGAAPPADPTAAEWGPLWGQRLLAMQVSSIYVFATFEKLTPGFLSGERLQHVLLERYGSSDPPSAAFELFCLVGAWSTVAIEGALAVGLWVPRIQRPLMLVGAAFHAMLFMVLPVGPFSLNMIALYLIFLDPGAVHRAVGRLLGDTPVEAARKVA